MKTYDHGYEDSKDKDQSSTSGKNSARNMVLRYIESLSQEQIYRMIDEHTKSRFIKKKDDPTGREIMRRSMEQNGFTIQAKLEISTPEDAHEKQADDLADAVSENDTSKSQNILNEKPADIQTKGEGGSLSTTPEFDQQLSATKGQGQSLDDATKGKLEQHTGTDLSDVKIHTDSTASALSEGINAKAFTHGQDIYFKDGNYDPKSAEGEKLLSHEVAHTVQQSDGVARKVFRYIDPKANKFIPVKKNTTGRINPIGTVLWDNIDKKDKVVDLVGGKIVDVLYKSPDGEWYFVIGIFDGGLKGGYVYQNQVELVQRDEKGKVQQDVQLGSQLKSHALERLRTVLNINNIDYSQLEQNLDEFQRVADLMENINLLMVLLENPSLLQPNVPHVTGGTDGEKLVVGVTGKMNVEFKQTASQLNITYTHNGFSFQAGDNLITTYKGNYTSEPLKVGATTKDEAWKIAAQYLKPNTGQKFEYNGTIYAFGYKSVTENLEANDHIIQQGETIASIARAKGLTEEELLSSNGYSKNPDDGSIIDSVTGRKHTFAPGDLIVIPEKEEPEDNSWRDKEDPTMLAAYDKIQGDAKFEMDMATIMSIKNLEGMTKEHYDAFMAYYNGEALIGGYTAEQVTSILQRREAGETYFYETEMYVVNFRDFLYANVGFPPGSLVNSTQWKDMIDTHELHINRFAEMFQEKAYEVALDLLRVNRYILLNEAEKYGIFNNSNVGYDFSSVRDIARNAQGPLDEFWSNQEYVNEQLSLAEPGEEYEPTLGYGVHVGEAESTEYSALSRLGMERRQLTEEDPLINDDRFWPGNFSLRGNAELSPPIDLQLPDFSNDATNSPKPLNVSPKDPINNGKNDSLYLNPQFFIQPRKRNLGNVDHPKSAIEEFQTASDSEIANRIRPGIIEKLKQIQTAEDEINSHKDQKHFIWRCPQIIEETKMAMGITGLEPYESILKAPPARLEALDSFFQIVTMAVAIGLLFIPGGGLLAWAVSAGIQGFALYKQYENNALKKKMYEASIPFGKTLGNEDPDLDWLWLDIVMILADIPGALKILQKIGGTAKKFINGTTKFSEYKKVVQEATETVGENGQKIVRNSDEFVENVANKYDPAKTNELADVQQANKSRKKILANADEAEVQALRDKYPNATDNEIAGHLKLKGQGALYEGLIKIFGDDTGIMHAIARLSNNSDHFLKGVKILRAGLDDDLFAQVMRHYLGKSSGKMHNIISSIGKSKVVAGDIAAIAKKMAKGKLISKKMDIFHQNLLMTLARRAGGGERGMKNLRFVLGNLDKRYARKIIKEWETKFGQSKKFKLSEVFDDFSNVAGNFRRSNETLLEFAEPKLLDLFKRKKLPPAVQKRFEELLEQDLIGNTEFLHVARSNVSSSVNKAIGESITSLDDFKVVMNLVEQPGSRGSIGEIFFKRFLAGTETASEKYRQVLFDMEALGAGATRGVKPDRIRPLSKRSMDVKAGYADSGIDVEQLKNYERLVVQSKKPGSKVQKQLANLDVEDGLKGHDYLFLPGKSGTSREAAEKAFETIAKTADDPKNFKVYYVDDAGNIFEYLGKNQKPNSIGTKMPD